MSSRTDVSGPSLTDKFGRKIPPKCASPAPPGRQVDFGSPFAGRAGLPLRTYENTGLEKGARASSLPNTERMDFVSPVRRVLRPKPYKLSGKGSGQQSGKGRGGNKEEQPRNTVASTQAHGPGPGSYEKGKAGPIAVSKATAGCPGGGKGKGKGGKEKMHKGSKSTKDVSGSSPVFSPSSLFQLAVGILGQ